MDADISSTAVSTAEDQIVHRFDIVRGPGLLQTDHSCWKLATVLFVFLDWAGNQSLDLDFYYWQEAKTKEKQNWMTT